MWDTVDFQLDMSLIFGQFLTSGVPKLSLIFPIFIDSFCTFAGKQP